MAWCHQATSQYLNYIDSVHSDLCHMASLGCNELIHCVYHICITELSQHQFSWWLNACSAWRLWINTLRLRQDGCHFPDDIFKCIFSNENVWIPIKISLKFVPKGPINNIPALVQIMAWRRPGDKPLSEPMMLRLPTHICVTRPQWVKPLLIHIMAYYLFGAKPLNEPILVYCQ